MKKFIALYYNHGGHQEAPPAMTEAEKAAMMAPWGAWQAKYGERIVDLGAPLQSASSSHDGNTWSGSGNAVSGYSIVSAISLVPDDLEKEYLMKKREQVKGEH